MPGAISKGSRKVATLCSRIGKSRSGLRKRCRGSSVGRPAADSVQGHVRCCHPMAHPNQASVHLQLVGFSKSSVRRSVALVFSGNRPDPDRSSFATIAGLQNVATGRRHDAGLEKRSFQPVPGPLTAGPIKRGAKVLWWFGRSPVSCAFLSPRLDRGPLWWNAHRLEAGRAFV